MNLNIIISKNNNELYLELNIFYNIGLLILGILAIICNIIFCYIIWKEKLWNQSIQYVFTIIIAISGGALGIRHVIVSIVNITIFDPNIASYDFPLCKLKSCLDVLIIYIFEVSFGLRMSSYTILVGFPVFYRNYLENVKNNKYIIIFVLLFSLTFSLFYAIDIDDSKETENCNIYSFTGKTYEYCFMVLLFVIIGISIPIFIFGIYTIVKLNINKAAKNSVIRLFNYHNFVFIFCWVPPNGAIVLSFLEHSNEYLIGLIYDVSLFNTTIVAIAEFIFAILHNKTIRNYAAKLVGLKNKINTTTNFTN